MIFQFDIIKIEILIRYLILYINLIYLTYQYLVILMQNYINGAIKSRVLSMSAVFRVIKQ